MTTRFFIEFDVVAFDVVERDVRLIPVDGDDAQSHEPAEEKKHRARARIFHAAGRSVGRRGGVSAAGGGATTTTLPRRRL